MADPRRILIIQTAYAGDVVLTTPLIEAASRRFPDAELHALVIPQTACLLQGNPHLTRIWRYDKRGSEKGLSALVTWARRLAAEGFDLSLIPHRSLRSALLAWAAGIPLRIGFDTSAGSFLLNHHIPYKGHGHEILRNLALLGPFGWEGPPPRPHLYPGQDEKEAVMAFLKREGLAEKPRVALAPGSVWPTKRWPAERFAETASRLFREGWIPIVIGGPEDRPLAETIGHLARGVIVDAIGRFSFMGSAELLRQCQVAVTNDSAPCHLSVAVGTPVVALFGPTLPSFGFAPYGPHNRVVETPKLVCRPCGIHGGKRCSKGHFACMKSITVDRVVEAIHSLVGEHHRKNEEVTP